MPMGYKLNELRVWWWQGYGNCRCSEGVATLQPCLSTMDSQISYDCYDLPLRIVLVVFVGFGSNSNMYDSLWF